MPRTCFVIMPFSSTESCTEAEWTRIYEELFKPAVEGAGLDYSCRRSVATRGNIVGSILQDLKEAYVVIADLTDRNPNVFYELGVRHTLMDRSIILVQDRAHIPFDLRPYANHVYEWRTEEGRAALTHNLRRLLAEVDDSPDRADNPVSDFLGRTTPSGQSPDLLITPSDVPIAQPLAGPGAEGLDATAFVRRLASSRSPNSAKSVLRLTRFELRPLMRTTMGMLNQRTPVGQITKGEILRVALEHISAGEPHTAKLEEFALSSIEEGWVPGVRVGLSLAGDLISLSEEVSGHTLRFARGLPALLAWRLLILMGAKALEQEAFESLGIILKEPIEVERENSRFSYLPLPERRELFYPEALLGYADHAIRYLVGLWERSTHIHQFFGFEEDYHVAVAQFLMIIALMDARREEGHPLYPGYRLVPQSRRAMGSLCGRLARNTAFLDGIAQAMGESPIQLKAGWASRIARANSAELGHEYFPSDGVHFPDPIDATVEAD